MNDIESIVNEVATAVELPTAQVLATDDNEYNGNGNINLQVFELSLRSTKIELCSLGASITKFVVDNDKDDDDDDDAAGTGSGNNNGTKGQGDDIVLGYKDIKTLYQSKNPVYFSSIVGRVANRIANGKFQLNHNKNDTSRDDTTKHEYKLEINNPPNHLHGGSGGFSHQNWKGKIISLDSTRRNTSTNETSMAKGHVAVQFTLTSVDGDQGYPGTVEVVATYSLRPSITSSTGVILRLDMSATLLSENEGPKYIKTPINLAQHSYFNLSGHKNATTTCKNDNDTDHKIVNPGILDHTLSLASKYYTPINEKTLIPTRTVQSLDDDPIMDWRKGRTLRDAIYEYGIKYGKLTKEQIDQDFKKRSTVSDEQQQQQQQQQRKKMVPYGFDHNYIVDKNELYQKIGLAIPHVGTLTCPNSKRQLNVYSTAPGVQVYTSNYLNSGTETSDVCKDTYGPWSGICLETQHFPDSIIDDDTIDGTTTNNKNTDDNVVTFAQGKCPILTSDQPHYQHIVEYHYTRLDGTNNSNQDSSSNSNTGTADDGQGQSLPIVGSDIQGNKFTSISSMWQRQDLQSWYVRAKDYYEENCSSTVDGVLGGIGWISDIDLDGSRKFIQDLQTANLLPKKATTSTTASTSMKSTYACECGAGIGRVTKGLLLDVCDKCDLVESSERLLFASPEYIGNDKASKCRFFCTELQNWTPPPCSTVQHDDGKDTKTKKNVPKYTLIWIQWVACYLTDADLIQFLKRCGESLVPNDGVIVLKENTCTPATGAVDGDDDKKRNGSTVDGGNGESFVVDVDDGSLTRSLPYWLDIIFQSGLTVVACQWQTNFPDDIYPVPMLALKPMTMK